MKKSSGLYSVVILSQLTHLFCCVLPGFIALISLAAGFGFAGTYVDFLHDFAHDYEPAIMIFSTSMLVLGWGVYSYSRLIDCHSTGCVHPPCEPKKDIARLILLGSTALFLLNLSVWIASHSH